MSQRADTRSYKGNSNQKSYGVASWNISTPDQKRYSKFGTLKAAQEHYVGDAYIADENWKRLLAGEVVPSVDDENFVYGLAWARDKFYPSFY